MLIKVCDKCGKKIDRMDFPFLQVTDYPMFRIWRIGRTYHSDEEETINLCMDCEKAFDEWLKTSDKKRET